MADYEGMRWFKCDFQVQTPEDDAEFIYALEARDGKGKTLAQGGLDRAPVARAVLDIMEGSERAFKRIGEKCPF